MPAVCPPSHPIPNSMLWSYGAGFSSLFKKNTARSTPELWSRCTLLTLARGAAVRRIHRMAYAQACCQWCDWFVIHQTRLGGINNLHIYTSTHLHVSVCACGVCVYVTGTWTLDNGHVRGSSLRLDGPCGSIGRRYDLRAPSSATGRVCTCTCIAWECRWYIFFFPIALQG